MPLVGDRIRDLLRIAASKRSTHYSRHVTARLPLLKSWTIVGINIHLEVIKIQIIKFKNLAQFGFLAITKKLKFCCSM